MPSNDNNSLLFNSLPDDKNFFLSKFKAFADDNLNMAEKMESVLEKALKLWKKRENTGYRQLFPFSEMLSETILNILLCYLSFMS